MPNEKHKGIMKKIIKYVAIIPGLMLLGIIFTGILLNKPLPQGKEGPRADALARKMLNALQYAKYKDTRYIAWSYQGGAHHYKWDKKLGKVTVKWGDYTVKLNLVKTSKSIARKKNIKLSTKESKDLIVKARDYFNNDSFWLVASYKVFDEGTKRSLVTLEDGSNALLVSYIKGGTTPGDSYLWKLRENGFPISFQMWTTIIPVGGLEASWDAWQITENGAILPKSHKLGPFTLEIGDLRTFN